MWVEGKQHGGDRGLLGTEGTEIWLTGWTLVPSRGTVILGAVSWFEPWQWVQFSSVHNSL